MKETLILLYVLRINVRECKGLHVTYSKNKSDNMCLPVNENRMVDFHKHRNKKQELEWNSPENNFSIMNNFKRENDLKGPVVKIIQKQKKQLQDSLGHQWIEDGSGDKEVGDGMDYMELLKIVIH